MKHFLRIAALLALFAFPSGAEAANRFAVCTTTCTWDNSSTAMWSASSGGATGASVPSSSDAVIFDGATCVGGTTCTTTVAATINGSNTIQSLTAHACTGTTTGCILDFSVNNPSITFTSTSASAAVFLGGTGTRAYRFGSGTFTFSAGGGFDLSTTTNLQASTFNSATFVLSSTAISSQQTFGGGGQSYGTLTITGRPSGQQGALVTGANTFANLNIAAPSVVNFNGVTQIVTGTMTVSGSGNSFVMFPTPTAQNTTSQFTVTGATVSVDHAMIRGVIFSGATVNATNSYDLGVNTMGTITPPATGSGGRIIGG